MAVAVSAAAYSIELNTSTSVQAFVLEEMRLDVALLAEALR